MTGFEPTRFRTPIWRFIHWWGTRTLWIARSFDMFLYKLVNMLRLCPTSTHTSWFKLSLQKPTVLRIFFIYFYLFIFFKKKKYKKKKNSYPLTGFEPTTFRTPIGRFIHWATKTLCIATAFVMFLYTLVNKLRVCPTSTHTSWFKLSSQKPTVYGSAK